MFETLATHWQQALLRPSTAAVAILSAEGITREKFHETEMITVGRRVSIIAFDNHKFPLPCAGTLYLTPNIAAAT